MAKNYLLGQAKRTLPFLIMGINCQIFLESSAKPNEIIQVILKVLGFEGEKTPLPENGKKSKPVILENPCAKGNILYNDCFSFED